MTNHQVLAMIESLRTQCDAINRVDPDGPAYQALVRFLNGLDQDHLRVLAAAKIKWISRLALNRVTAENEVAA